ncbi:unnamed protein product [Absidia cylindrospora]
MLLDGKKVACATCIKGHRATHCKHKDRVMVEIKKKVDHQPNAIGAGRFDSSVNSMSNATAVMKANRNERETRMMRC